MPTKGSNNINKLHRWDLSTGQKSESVDKLRVKEVKVKNKVAKIVEARTKNTLSFTTMFLDGYRLVFYEPLISTIGPTQGNGEQSKQTA